MIKKSRVISGLDQPNTSQLNSDCDRVRIFPSIKFGCNGIITHVTFAADSKEPISSLTGHAELQLWSELQVWFVSITGTYTRRNRASLEDATPTSDLNVYEKSFSQPLRFQTGDILGFYSPPEGSSPLELYHQGGAFAFNKPSYSLQQSNSLNLFNTNNAESDNSVPLMSLEIGKFANKVF